MSTIPAATNTAIFSGKAQAYADARPGYPEEAMDYIAAIVRKDAVFADIGAGTGKFTEIIARRGYRVFAVEPNADMRRQLTATLEPYPTAAIVAGSAEETTLPSHSVDAITCAQALHWFDHEAFRAQCERIGKPGYIVIGVHNTSPGENSVANGSWGALGFFSNPIVREFPNPVFYDLGGYIKYRSSHAKDPLPSDPGYNAHIDAVEAEFREKSVDGLLRRDVVTMVIHERLE